MSNPMAIAAVTATVRNLLEQGINRDASLNFTAVTVRSPDKARQDSDTGNQINLFLYHTLPNAAWRNQDMPRQVRAGEQGYPPLALNLAYLLTAYGRDNDEIISHRLLGQAMSVLHDHPLLGANEIEAALANNDLHTQVERVRLTPMPLSLEELSKLWTTFQTQYRISAFYQAAVVLIESSRAVQSALPVLQRGKQDRGADVQAANALPILEQVQLPPQQSGVRLAETLTLEGRHFFDAPVLVRVRHFRLSAPLDIPATSTGTSVSVPLQINPATDATTFPAGFYTVAVVVTRNDHQWSSNELPFVLAPRLTNLPLSVARVGGTATITLACTPAVQPEQRAVLLMGDREIVANAHSTVTSSLEFEVSNATAGSFLVRLRVDGADSLLVDQTSTTPNFDQSQKVTIT